MAAQPQSASDELGLKDKVAILLKEYDTLRTEILARDSNGYQLWAGAAAAIAWVTSRPVDWRLWILAAALTLIFLGIFAALYRDINALCKRVSTIERMVNSLAGGEELLEWETRWGGASPNGWLCWKRSRK
jgi:hypothetical protein